MALYNCNGEPTCGCPTTDPCGNVGSNNCGCGVATENGNNGSGIGNGCVNNGNLTSNGSSVGNGCGISNCLCDPNTLLFIAIIILLIVLLRND